MQSHSGKVQTSCNVMFSERKTVKLTLQKELSIQQVLNKW